MKTITEEFLYNEVLSHITPVPRPLFQIIKTTPELQEYPLEWVRIAIRELVSMNMVSTRKHIYRKIEGNQVGLRNLYYR